MTLELMIKSSPNSSPPTNSNPQSARKTNKPPSASHSPQTSSLHYGQLIPPTNLSLVAHNPPSIRRL